MLHFSAEPWPSPAAGGPEGRGARPEGPGRGAGPGRAMDPALAQGKVAAARARAEAANAGGW